ncbi:hypothetical protein EKD04_008735 [Chloroflexales bacterium ZM16-3]|nr:hypothetical protein [Chloroflexales bacterium ZM16-3]
MARVRRGCLGVAALFMAVSLLFVTSTGNLFYLVFLIGSVISLLLWRVTR